MAKGSSSFTTPKIVKLLRYNLKDNKECLEIPVVFSTEVVAKHGEVIGSNSIIPNMFGLYMASFILNDKRWKMQKFKEFGPTIILIIGLLICLVYSLVK